MPVRVSPGVYTTEYDFSYYSQQLSTSIFGIVCTAPKGPTEERTFISNEASLVETFGTPSANHLGLLSAIRYLRRGNQLWVVRVAGYSEATGTGYIKNTNSADAVLLTPLSSGSWANSVSVVITDSVYGGGKKLTVTDSGVAVERYENVTISNIESVVNGNSTYFTVSVVVPAVALANGTYSISGGNDGATVTDADIIGVYDPVTNTRTGLQLFNNAEAVDVNILAVPGFSSANVVNELLSLCENRADCFALIDPPYGLTVQEVVDWHNGLSTLPDAPAAALNSSYGALYWSWLDMYDGYSASNMWLPPSGPVAGILAYTDQNYDPWFAPAGYLRGRLLEAKDVEYSPDQGERDYLYGGTNAVNPFVKFIPDGITLWGQKTLLRNNVSTNRVNVRRMMLYARKLVATSVRYLVFEPNDAFTRLQFRNLVEPIMADIQARRGLTDFRVICDETNNPPAVIDRNELHGKILMKPTKAAEVIEVGFTLIPTGAVFEEY